MNIVTVVAFQQALEWKEQTNAILSRKQGEDSPVALPIPPPSVTSCTPMVLLVVILMLLAGVAAVVTGLADPGVHTPYLNGFMDPPLDVMRNTFGDAFISEPENALTVAT